MKINHRSVTANLTKPEVADFEAWGTEHNFNVNQAVKRAIAFAVQHKKPEKVEPALVE